ncbi:MAG TPA: FIST N-terminal domain-containing protein [Haliangiales bacterium]|nr:FIST N-terminal domain-containing protein [Haliangiales bacterium]
MQDEFASTGHWNGGFEEAGLQSWAEQLRGRLRAPRVSIGMVFMTPGLFPHAGQVLEILRVHGQIPLLVGCSSASVIVGEREIEDSAGLALGLFSLPGAELQAVHFTQEQVEEANGPAYWHLETGISPDQTNGWLVLADPFHLDPESWLGGWNEAYAPLPVLGGLASGDHQEQTTQVYLNGEVFEGGGVAVSFGGDLRLEGVISQGCTPIGDTWTITKVERNLIHEIGNRPAYQVLLETFNQLPAAEKKNAQGNLFVGLVINEYLEHFHRGDFLVRNLLGADPRSGVIAVGALPRRGQTIQFQRRDATAATEDLMALLSRAKEKLGDSRIYGGCLCSCNGRGHRLFGLPNHDAGLIQRELGPLGLAGFFCNGEIGPVGDRNFLHGYTASLALFVKK